MTRLLRIAVPLALVAACLLAGPANAQQPTASRVTLVLVPGLRWTDIEASSTPTLYRLIRTGAVGNVNARSRVQVHGMQGSPLESGLTISAGTWSSPVTGDKEDIVPAAYSVDEPYDGGSAAEGYHRITGQGVGSASVAFLGMPMTQRFNEQNAVGVVLGTLGEAIQDAGGTTAAIGNSDLGAPPGNVVELVRPAALAAMDTAGLVKYGDVSARLLKADFGAPYGVVTDMGALGERLDSLNGTLGTSALPHLTVIDPGDTYRAERFATIASESAATAYRDRAFQAADEIVALAEKALPPNGVLIVASQAPGPEGANVEGFGPIVVAGPGWSGYLTSPTTHRTGIVSNLDITATVLAILGVERPVQVLGNPMTATGAPSDPAERAAHLERLNATAVAIESARTRVIKTFIDFAAIVLILATIVLLRIGRWSARAAAIWSFVVRASLLAVIVIIPAAWLMFVFVRFPATQDRAVSVFAIASIVLWAIALLIQSRNHVRMPVAFLSLIAAAVFLADQWLGAPLSFNTLFGYSPLWAARFYGIGNEPAAALVGSSLVGAAFLFDQWPNARLTNLGRRWGIPLLGAVVVVTAAAPFLGANVGVLVWGMAAFGSAWVFMNGYRMTWRVVLVGLLVGLLVLAVFASIDLLGGGAQTHLGRALTSAQRGGVAALWTIVVSKVQMNLRIIRDTHWVDVLLVILAILALMLWRPRDEYVATIEANPHFSAAMKALLIGGLVSFFTEDSGVIMPAIMLLWVAVGLLYLMLASWPKAQAAAREAPKASSA